MSFFDFIKDRIGSILINLVGVMALAWFLVGVGNSGETVIIILSFWFGFNVIVFLVSYVREAMHYKELLSIARKVDKKYLLAEILPKEKTYQEGVYREILRLSNKSMVDEIGAIKRERREYREYVEQWVHEIKSPMAAMKLIGDNNKSGVTRKMLGELEKIDSFVEQALYYARSENVSEDYSIRRVSLLECCNRVMMKNKHLLMKSGINIDMDIEDDEVYSDEKWLTFIIDQIVNNSVKYTRGEDRRIEIFTRKSEDGINLCIKDNGVGIKESDLGRVFNKGFTGTLGREESRATGIGLYLVKKLVDKLHHEIDMFSKEGEGTKVTIRFREK